MKYKKLETVGKTLALVIAGVLIGVSANISAQTWTNPTATPPSGNAAGPINTSNTAQTKTGSLALTGATSVFSVGTLAVPVTGTALDVYGKAAITSLGVNNLVIATGTPTAGKVLVAADSSGSVKWVDPATQTISGASTAVLETVLIPFPCPPKIMTLGTGETVFTPTYAPTDPYGNNSICSPDYTARMFAYTGGGTQGLDAFCQSIGYRAYMSATFHSFSSPGNNRVIKFDPNSTSQSKFRFYLAASTGNNRIASSVTCQRIVSVPDLSPIAP